LVRASYQKKNKKEKYEEIQGEKQTAKQTHKNVKKIDSNYYRVFYTAKVSCVVLSVPSQYFQRKIYC